MLHSPGFAHVVAIGILAVAVAASAFALLQWYASETTIEAGFWYEDAPFTLPPDAAETLGGPLSLQEIASIKRLSRSEIERAFSGLRITLSDSRQAFWKVGVVQELDPKGRPTGPRVGESFVFGPLGGTGSVSFLSMALNALRHAPPGASRQTIIEGIGRGIGGTAVHEFAHQILGSTPLKSTDPNSYEYDDANRPSQYYGTLHWSTAWPILQGKIGR
jgi:hypothetical protein